MIMMKHKLTTWCMIFIAHLITGRSCNFQVSLKAPRYADVGGQVVLECEYDIPGEQLHKVEWLKGGRKLFQYVKGRTPPFRNYTTPGAVLDVSTTSL
ncbi:hypothetical protein GE061_019372 [Apolygus lucorum]|uniref:Ig-like domain-containing protein n=1 Tax=Apolygus lucorum TaxID=248454 RepID=A0A8S9XCC9_APOLU|nr:hypothetical protein GE061_019372 [Apolygus lucorum]